MRVTVSLTYRLRRSTHYGTILTTRRTTSTSRNLRRLVKSFGLGHVTVGGRRAGRRKHSTSGLHRLGRRVHSVCATMVAGRRVLTCGRTGATLSRLMNGVRATVGLTIRKRSPGLTTRRVSYSNSYNDYNKYRWFARGLVVEGTGTVTRLSPVVRRFLRVGRRGGSTVVFFHLNSFCRAFFSRTGIISHRLRLALANHSYNLRRHTPVYNIPCRDCRSRMTHLITGKCGITVYRRARSPTRTGNLIGQRIIHILAPNAIVRNDVLSRNHGGFLTIICNATRDMKIYFYSDSAKRICTARVGNRSLTSHIGGRLKQCVPDRVLIGSAVTRGNAISSFVAGHLNNAVRRHSSSRFSVTVTARTIPTRFNGSGTRRLSLNSGPTTLVTINYTLRCLTLARVAKLRHIGGLRICRSGRRVQLSVATHHGLRLLRAVHTGRGHNSLLKMLSGAGATVKGHLLHS